MPLTIPPFNQYQSPIVPLRGLWNVAPAEGDKFITAEIDWLVTTTQHAVQFAVSANSPVAFSQIVALAVDNSRSGADVDFVFSDSGFVLTVPATNQGVFPVFTNGLMFYAISRAAVIGDITTFQVLNSMPPPTYIAPSVEQNLASDGGIPVANGTTQVIPAGVNGTLNTLSIIVYLAGAAAQGGVNLFLIDGAGHTVWETATWVAIAPAVAVIPINLTGMSVRFTNGLSLVQNGVTTAIGGVAVNLYFSTP